MGYAGCRMFVSPSGGAGIALQADGELAGYLWDFFVSPHEKPRTLYELLLVALEAGGKMVAIWKEPLLARFFELFGFQAVGLTRRDQKDVVLMNLITGVFKARAPRLREVAAQLSQDTDLPGSGAPGSGCSFCRGQLQEPQVVRESFSGYECSRCRFIRLYGSLTLGAPEPATE